MEDVSSNYNLLQRSFSTSRRAAPERQHVYQQYGRFRNVQLRLEPNVGD
jgi:hypothetical protein